MGGRVIILSGPPGAGKSTVAGMLARRYPLGVHLHTDDFWHAIVSGAVPPYLPEADRQNQAVLAVIASAAAGYARGGYTTVVDGVLGPWTLPHFRAEAEGFDWHYLVLRPARHVTLGRAVARTGRDDLTEEGPILTMWDQFAELGGLERNALDTSAWDAEGTVDAVWSAVESRTHMLPG